MLEVLIKSMLGLMIIAFFLIISLRSINESADFSFSESKIAELINDLENNSFNDPGLDGYIITNGEGSQVVCRPSLINNHAGRVCIAS